MRKISALKLSASVALVLGSMLGAAAHAETAPLSTKSLNNQISFEVIQSAEKGYKESGAPKATGARLHASFQQDILGVSNVYGALQFATSTGDKTIEDDEEQVEGSVDFRGYELRLGKSIALSDTGSQLTPYLVFGQETDEVSVSSGSESVGLKLKNRYAGLGAMYQAPLGNGLFLTGDFSLTTPLQSDLAGTGAWAGDSLELDGKWRASAGLALTYFIDKNLSVTGHYKYRTTDFGGEYTSKIHQVGVGLAYHF